MGKWLLIKEKSPFIIKLCYENLFKFNFISNRSMSNYENILKSWALTGQRSELTQNKSNDIIIRNDLQLIGAQICFRHGARTPIYFLPGLEQVVYSEEHIASFLPAKWDVKLIPKIGNDIVSRDKILSANDVLADVLPQLKSVSGEKVVAGQLTAIGEKQLYELGKFIRNEIIKEDENKSIANIYDPNTVYCRSTFVDRTIASARSFLAGFFSSEGKDGEVQAKGPFEIEVHSYRQEDMFPNRHAYPILKKCTSATEFYDSLHDEHDLKKARQALIDRIGVNDYPFGILELHDDIASRQIHDFNIPDEYTELTKDFEIMSAREFVSMATSIGLDAFIRATVGPLLYLMKENFEAISKHYIEEKENNTKKPYQTFFVYGGHDTTIIPLAMALEIFNMRWPTYATYILFKYYVSKTDPNERYISINYDGEPQILPNCDSYYCPYSTFLKILENRFETPKFLTNN